MGVAPRPAVIAGAALAIIAGLLVFGWIGGELHYSNCLQSVELRYPTAFGQSSSGSGNSFLNGYGSRLNSPGFVFYEQPQRNRALSNCSRWP